MVSELHGSEASGKMEFLDNLGTPKMVKVEKTLQSSPCQWAIRQTCSETQTGNALFL